MKKILVLLLFVTLCACEEENDPSVIEAPVAAAASDITNEGFTANWNESPGANDYELDVATDVDFSDIVDSQSLLAASSSYVGDLDSNTEYFYRVRATFNGEDPSDNSNFISVWTLPDAPVATDATDISSSGFAANWNAVPGVTDYVLSVSVDNFPADPPNNLPDYDGKEVTGTSHEVTGLTSGTIYYYVVQAQNDDRVSDMSDSMMVTSAN